MFMKMNTTAWSRKAVILEELGCRSVAGILFSLRGCLIDSVNTTATETMSAVCDGYGHSCCHEVMAGGPAQWTLNIFEFFLCQPTSWMPEFSSIPWKLICFATWCKLYRGELPKVFPESWVVDRFRNRKFSNRPHLAALVCWGMSLVLPTVQKVRVRGIVDWTSRYDRSVFFYIAALLVGTWSRWDWCACRVKVLGIGGLRRSMLGNVQYWCVG